MARSVAIFPLSKTGIQQGRRKKQTQTHAKGRTQNRDARLFHKPTKKKKIIYKFHKPTKKRIFAQDSIPRARVHAFAKPTAHLTLCFTTLDSGLFPVPPPLGRPPSCVGFGARSLPEHMVKDSTSLPSCHARRHCVKCDPKLSLVLDKYILSRFFCQFN